MQKIYKRYILPVLLVLAVTGCKKWYGVPPDTDFISPQAIYTVTSFSPTIGRTTLFTGIFNPDGSTLPLNFQIVNVRKYDGTPSTDLAQLVPVQVWRSAYTGNEASRAEIEAKRDTEMHPVFEVRKSGDFILWNGSTNALLPNYQSATSKNGYLFDVQFSNGGGTNVLKNFTLTPLLERPYNPSNLNMYTGTSQAATDSILPTSLTGMVGQNSRVALSNNNKDVYVYFKRVGNGNSITFKFLDPAKNPIDPSLFNQTNWASLVHGFNMQMTSTYVKYDVSYPIPLVTMPTKYTTTDGSMAAVTFSYTRLGFNNIRQTGVMTFNFNIFRQGDWEIDFHFRNDSPRFQNEY